MAEEPRLSLRAYGVLLRLFPRTFRARFGADMTHLFADNCRDARRRGAGAVLRLWARTIVTLPQHAAAERRAARRMAQPSPYIVDSRGVLMAGLSKDLLWAARGLLRRPGFALAACTMLAVGLGFNTALFALVHAVLLKPLPYVNADRIVMAWTGRNPDGTGGVNSYADYVDWKARSTSFDTLATYNISFGTLTDAGDPEEVGGATVSPEFFTVLGARMQYGRAIQPGDELVALDQGRPIVIAHSLWTHRFHGDPNIIGRSLVLNGRRRPVVGVLAPEFKQPEPLWGTLAEYWTPLTISDELKSQRAFHFLRVIGRLKPGRSLSVARAEMDGIGKSLMAAFPITNTKSVVLAPIRDELVGDTGPLLWMFLGAVSLVLLLAVANIVNLLLARASGRRTEFALRATLGATRGRLISQLVCESTLIGLIGGAAGLLFAQACLRLLIRYGQVTAPGIEDAGLDGAVLLFAIALSALTGALCGLLPALRVVRAQLVGSTVSDMRGSHGLDVSRTRRWLVAVETALAVPLLVGAALLAQTLIRMQSVDPGFDAAHALQFRVTLNGPRYNSPEKLIEFFDRLREGLGAIPEARAVGMVSSLPLGGLNNTGGTVSFRKVDGSIGDTSVGYRTIGGNYFKTLGVRLIAGRVFDDAADTEAIIVNDVAAHEMWGDASPLGRQVRLSRTPGSPMDRWLTVVGVVGSMRHEALTRSANAETFVPYRTNAWPTMTVTIRGEGDPLALAGPARDVMRKLDAQIPLVNLAPISEFIDGQLARPRFGVMCAVVFGIIGLALAAFGTFAVLSLLVAQRTREIGIRMALGATRHQILALITRQSLVPAVVGCLVGGALAEWLAGALSSQLFGVTAHDPRAFLWSVGLLTASACLASWWPSRRATRVNPITALRGD
jgi:putative ABC transport system permease protein